MLSPTQFSETHSKLATEGGFTVNPRTGENVTSGISVAPLDNEMQVPVAQSTPGTLQAYAESPGNQARFERGHATHLGGWRNEGTDYLDTPTVHPHTPGGGGEARARKQMVLSDQMAGFDLDTFEEKPNPFNPDTRAQHGMEPHEIAGPSREGMPTGERRRRAEFAASQPEVQSWINAPRRGRREG